MGGEVGVVLASGNKVFAGDGGACKIVGECTCLPHQGDAAPSGGGDAGDCSCVRMRKKTGNCEPLLCGERVKPARCGFKLTSLEMMATESVGGRPRGMLV